MIWEHDIAGLSGNQFNTPGYLVISHYDQDKKTGAIKAGVIAIYSFSSLRVSPIWEVKGRGPGYTVTLGRAVFWTGAQEPNSWKKAERKVPPLDRVGRAYQLNFGMNDLTIIPNPRGGRFLSLSSPVPTENHSLVVCHGETDSEAKVLTGVDNFGWVLREALEKIGVPCLIAEDVCNLVSLPPFK